LYSLDIALDVLPNLAMRMTVDYVLEKNDKLIEFAIQYHH